MNLKEYQEQVIAANDLSNLRASTTLPSCIGEKNVTLLCCIGMADGAGACMNKLRRGMMGLEFDRDGYILELGKILTCLAIACHHNNTSLDRLNYSQSTENSLYDTKYSTCALFAYINELLNALNWHGLGNCFPQDHMERCFGQVLRWIVQCGKAVDATLEDAVNASNTAI